MLKKMLSSFFIFYCVSSFANSDIEKFKQSWTANALKLQREIDLDTPLNQATFLGTHNSENAKAYAIPFVRYIDPNQIVSIYDQLELGIRSLEFDVHWTVGKHFSKEILLCHGQQNHVGCSMFDKPVAEGLQEVRDWLKANPNEVVILYFDKSLDDHEPLLADLLNQYLGQFIYKTNTLNCSTLPPNLTKREVLDSGKQIILVTKKCDNATLKATWNQLVFAGFGGQTDEPFSMLDSTYNSFRDYPDCAKSTTFLSDPEHTSIWRIFEDRTILSNIVEKQKKIEIDEMKELNRCGINQPTLDMLSVGDARLNAAIWSWAESFPKKELGECAIYKNNRIENTDCSQVLTGFVCHRSGTDQWQMISAKGEWKEGEKFCQQKGPDWHFATPINAKEMDQLSGQKTSNPVAWLNYVIDNKGKWTPNKI